MCNCKAFHNISKHNRYLCNLGGEHYDELGEEELKKERKKLETDCTCHLLDDAKRNELFESLLHATSVSKKKLQGKKTKIHECIKYILLIWNILQGEQEFIGTGKNDNNIVIYGGFLRYLYSNKDSEELSDLDISFDIPESDTSVENTISKNTLKRIMSTLYRNLNMFGDYFDNKSPAYEIYDDNCFQRGYSKKMERLTITSRQYHNESLIHDAFDIDLSAQLDVNDCDFDVNNLMLTFDGNKFGYISARCDPDNIRNGEYLLETFSNIRDKKANCMLSYREGLDKLLNETNTFSTESQSALSYKKKYEERIKKMEDRGYELIGVENESFFDYVNRELIKMSPTGKCCCCENKFDVNHKKDPYYEINNLDSYIRVKKENMGDGSEKIYFVCQRSSCGFFKLCEKHTCTIKKYTREKHTCF